MSAVRLLAACALALCATATSAFETVTYRYDPLGRLTKVAHSGSGLSACYAYDKADNRKTVKIATAYSCAGPPPSFSISSDGPITEGGGSVFTVTKTGTATASLSVHYATANGTAVSPGDFSAKSGTLTFTPADTSLTVTVTTVNDTAAESAEAFTMVLSTPTGGATIATGTATATINDNEPAPAPSFSINDVSVNEGGILVFTVTKTGSTASSFSITYTTANGTATSGSDYTGESHTLTFEAADTSKPITVATTEDTMVEGNETVLVNLSGATGGATITDTQGVGTINNDDVAINECAGVSYSINDTSVDEGGGGVLVFTVTKSGSTTGTCAVDFATGFSGTASSGTDFTATSGTLTFGPSETSKTVNVQVKGDRNEEPDESVFVNLASPTGGATISDAQGRGWIMNDDFGASSTSPSTSDTTVDEPPPPESNSP